MDTKTKPSHMLLTKDITKQNHMERIKTKRQASMLTGLTILDIKQTSRIRKRGRLCKEQTSSMGYNTNLLVVAYPWKMQSKNRP